MRYIKAKFTNYIGFYNGMGLYDLEIDFTKCQHKIVLITAKNGAGKSTLLNHLNPFPDSSSDFIPEKTAEKFLILESEGDVYEISLISPADLKGRKTTKAYIKKNGIELNENGNVSSYKDIIFSEFELDSNYISLSNLSSTDRGMGDKTPAERKKFVSNIIDNLEIYNNMYKTLNKKSLIYKSHIGTLHTKIQNIGDRALLEQKLDNLRNREADLNAKILDCNNQIVAIQTKNSIDEEESIKIQEATARMNNSKNELDLLSIELDNFHHKTKIKKEDIVDKYNKDKDLLSTYKSKESELTTIWKDKSNRLSEVSNNILNLEAEINSSQLDDSISDRFSKSKKDIDEYKLSLKQLKISDDISQIFEISNLIIFCDKFITLVDHFYDNIELSDIEYLVFKHDSNTLRNLMNDQKSVLEEIDKINNQIRDLQSDLKVLSILEDRPDKCKIDTCPFISDAIKLKKSIKKDPIDEIQRLQEISLQLSSRSTEIQEIIDHVNSLLPKSTELDAIRRLISENERSLSKFYPDFLNNYNSMISNQNSFNDIREHKLLIDGLNYLKLLESELQNYKILEVEYNAFRDKIKLFNSSKIMLDNLKSEEKTLLSEISDLKTELDSYTNTNSTLAANVTTESLYDSKYKEYLEKLSEFEASKSIVDEFNKKSSKAIESLSIINELKGLIDSYSAELKPTMQEISTISGELTLVDSYYNEYNEYNQSYKIIETLKKYCSPTGGGIQTLFMQLYMSKTKELANSVLSMLFGGGYQLLDFIINDSEFRIPFIGEGLPVDDISSGSSAQISMMSMIINLVLLHQGSSKFSIAMLDEVNAALDTYNNAIFVNVIMQCMDILKIDQLFMISHSIDTDGSFADIIKLKGYDDYEFNLAGNIIFDYDEYIKQ